MFTSLLLELEIIPSQRLEKLDAFICHPIIFFFEILLSFVLVFQQLLLQFTAAVALWVARLPFN